MMQMANNKISFSPVLDMKTTQRRDQLEYSYETYLYLFCYSENNEGRNTHSSQVLRLFQQNPPQANNSMYSTHCSSSYNNNNNNLLFIPTTEPKLWSSLNSKKTTAVTASTCKLGDTMMTALWARNAPLEIVTIVFVRRIERRNSLQNRVRVRLGHDRKKSASG